MTSIERINTLCDDHLDQLEGVPLKVWLIYHRRANHQTEEAWPGVRQIAAKIGHKDTKRVREAIHWLIERGYLELIDAATFRTSATYRVSLPKTEGASSTTEGVKPPVKAEPTEGAKAHPQGATRPSPRGRGAPPNRTENRTKNSTHSARAFESFWKAYPDGYAKTDQDGARKLWAAKGLDERAGEVLEGLERWKRSGRWTEAAGRYVPNVAKWLKLEAWTQHPPPAAGQTAPIDPAKRAAEIEATNRAWEATNALHARKLERDLWILDRTDPELEGLKSRVVASSGAAGQGLAHLDPRRDEVLKWKIWELGQAQTPALAS